jgi:beta-N-acetylhexosaminidase
MLRTYINAYDSKPSTMETLVSNLLEGPDAFKGEDPIDSFCGLFDAKI